MRLMPRIIVCFVLISGANVRAQGTAPGAAESEAELLRLETALNEGVMHRDPTALERIVAEEFGLSVTDRPAAPRATWLANVKSISLSNYKITEPHVTVWGKAAVVRTRQHFDDYKSADGVALPPDYNIVDLWTYRAGRWQLVRRLSERLRQP